MPTDPYTIGGTVYDVGGAAIAVATVVIRAINVTQSLAQEERVWSAGWTDPTDGSYAIDLANQRIQDGTQIAWADGDAIQLHVWNANYTYYAGFRLTLDESSPIETQDLYLHPGGPNIQTCKLLGGWVNNESGSASFLEIYDIENDAKVCRINVATVSLVSLPLSIVGRKMPGGMCIIYDGTGQGLSFVRSVG